MVKPVADVALASLLLVVATPVMLLLMLLIKVSMGGETIFKQVRIGQHGRKFTIYKLKTMSACRRNGPQPYDGPDRRRTHKSDSDPRHTRLGRILRNLSLDELPQLLNVLRGEMSLIGPRPELAEVAEHYGFVDHPRHLLKPGITGVWQISSARSELLHENIDLDLEYLESASLRTDARIALATAGRFLRPLGR